MKILLVQTAFFGDVIIATPVIKALHEIHPGAEISVMATRAACQLLEHDSLIARMIPFDKRGAHRGIAGLRAMAAELSQYKFDRVYSLHSSYRTSILLALSGIPLRIGFKGARLPFLYHRLKKITDSRHAVLRKLAILDGEGSYDREAIGLRLFAPPEEKVSADVLAVAKNDQRRVLLFPGSEWKTKMWHWQEYRKVASHYLNAGWRVVVVGGKNERAVADAVSSGLSGIVNLAGKTTLAEVLFLVKNANLVVCNDSMALHAAGGFGTPVVTVFCATSPSFGFGPWMTPARVVEHETLPCKPCRRHGGRECPLGTEECMRGVPAARVINAAEELLQDMR